MGLRIGFDITSLFVANAGVFWYDYNLLKAMLALDSDHDFTLLDYRPIHGGWRNPAEIQTLAGPNVHTVHSGGLRHYRLSRWRHAQRRPLSSLARGVDRILKPVLSRASNAVMNSRLTQVLDGVDVFHMSDVVAWAHPRAANVCTIHDVTVLLFPQYHTRENRELHLDRYRFAQDNAQAIIVGSQSTKTDIETHLGVKSERIRVVPYGVSPSYHPISDTAYVARQIAGLGLELGRYVLHVGTIEPRKNLVRLVQAYARMREEMNERSVKLALVGAIGWQSAPVLKTIEELGLKKEVVMTGSVPADVLPALYNGAAVMVYPSLYEGFGLPPLEAMACGTPVVSSDVSSIPEVVGDAGLLVDPTDIEQLTQAIGAVISDRDLQARLRSAGLARAQQFSWRKTAIETLHVYEELANRQ